MIYSLKAVRSGWKQGENRRVHSGAFWARYSMILCTIAEQPRAFGYHQTNQGGR